jgi:hypothetical protein
VGMQHLKKKKKGKKLSFVVGISTKLAKDRQFNNHKFYLFILFYFIFHTESTGPVGYCYALRLVTTDRQSGRLYRLLFKKFL